MDQTKIDKRRFDITLENIVIFVYISSVLLTPFYIRFSYSSYFAYVDVFFYASFALLALKYGLKISSIGIVIWALLTTIFVYSEVLASVSRDIFIKYFVMFCLPTLLCQLSVGKNRNIQIKIAEKIIKVVNFCVIFVFFTLIIDIITYGSWTSLVANIFDISALVNWNPQNTSRFPSIWGHFLITAGVYLIFFFLNIAFQRTQHRFLLPEPIIYLITFIGILSTAGKTALTILLISVVVLHASSSHRVTKALGLIVLIALLYYFNFFDTVLERFNVADPSGGRNTTTAMLYSIEKPHLLYGYGEGFVPHFLPYMSDNTISIASEYTLVALVYKFGILFCLLLFISIIVPAVRQALRNGSWILLFFAILLVVYFCSFNGMIVLPDVLMLLSVFGICCALLQPEIAIPSKMLTSH